MIKFFSFSKPLIKKCASWETHRKSEASHCCHTISSSLGIWIREKHLLPKYVSLGNNEIWNCVTPTLYHINAKCTSPYINITFVSYVDSLDWKATATPESIANRVINKTKSGSIILFHNDADYTPKALPVILKALLDKGYEFVFIEDLIYKDNYEIIHDGTQCKIN